MSKEAKLIEELMELVETACKGPDNTFGYTIWTHHIHPMIDVAKELAAATGADVEIVLIATLLHDYAGIKNKRYIKDHHIHGAAEAEKLLGRYNYPHQKVERIKKCIENHRASVNKPKTTIEEVCVADADAIVHILEFHSRYYVAYVKLGLSIEEGKDWILSTFQKDWEKLSEYGKQLTREKYETLCGIFDWST